jgi:hypothetical protein
MTVAVIKRVARCIKLNLVLVVINIVLSFVISFTTNTNLFLIIRNFFLTILLIEAGILFLIGGFTVYGGTIFVGKVRQYLFKSRKEWSPDMAQLAENRAISFFILAILLFFESIFLSLII